MHARRARDAEGDHVVDEEGGDAGRHRGDPTQVPRHIGILASRGSGREAALIACHGARAQLRDTISARPGGAMKIERIDAWICHFPFPEPFKPSWVPGLASPANSCVIYRLVTDEGLEGYTAFIAFADEAKGPINLMRAFLIGRDPTKPAELRPIIEAGVRVLGLKVWFVEAAIF